VEKKTVLVRYCLEKTIQVRYCLEKASKSTLDRVDTVDKKGCIGQIQ